MVKIIARNKAVSILLFLLLFHALVRFVGRAVQQQFRCGGVVVADHVVRVYHCGFLFHGTEGHLPSLHTILYYTVLYTYTQITNLYIKENTIII